MYSVGECAQDSLATLLQRFGLKVHHVAPAAAIPGSYWGAPEAGLIGGALYLRQDTPVHSALHEACHWICMTPARRESLECNAGGDDAEESAVCYLQLVLADEVAGFGRATCGADMDEWGYSFRLGSALLWFLQDADDARRWLIGHGLLHDDGRPRWHCRQGSVEARPRALSAQNARRPVATGGR